MCKRHHGIREPGLPKGSISMTDTTTDPNDDKHWKRLAARNVGELPTDYTTALRVLAYMAEILHFTDVVEMPITVETENIVLQFNRKTDI